MHELNEINLALINEPAQPLREAMDEEKMADLVDSMRSAGQLYPIIVVPDDVRFQIVDGHRRFLAARQLAWEKIKCLVFPDSVRALEAVKLHANIIREDVTPAEEAVFFAELMEKTGNDCDEVARLVHRSYDYVSDRLRLFQGRQEVFEALRKREITLGHARVLNRFKREELALYWLKMTTVYGTTVRQLEEECRKEVPQTGARAPDPPDSAAGMAAPETQGLKIECYLCGGTKDPYNLTLVYWHRHCLQWIERAKDKASKGE